LGEDWGNDSGNLSGNVGEELEEDFHHGLGWNGLGKDIIPPPSKPVQPVVRKFHYGEEHMVVAEHLKQRILANKPDAKLPVSLDGWADTVRRMALADQRTIPKIIAVIDWCQNDEFWRANILSMDKLRKQFDRLELQMDQQAHKPSRAAPGDYEATQASRRMYGG
jgi:hypothetical protein